MPKPDANLGQIDRKLDALLALSFRILRSQGVLMADLSALETEVSENGDAVASAVALLAALSAEITAAGTDPAALAALVDQLDANTAALADAVVANTPAAPPPTP